MRRICAESPRRRRKACARPCTASLAPAAAARPRGQTRPTASRTPRCRGAHPQVRLPHCRTPPQVCSKHAPHGWIDCRSLAAPLTQPTLALAFLQRRIVGWLRGPRCDWRSASGDEPLDLEAQPGPRLARPPRDAGAGVPRCGGPSSGVQGLGGCVCVCDCGDWNCRLVERFLATSLIWSWIFRLQPAQ